MVAKRAFSRRTLLSLAFAVLAGIAAAGGYFASQASYGTTAAQEGASTPTATPRSAVVFGMPPPGVERGSWTPVPRCPDPTPTPTPPPRDVAPTPTPTPGAAATSGDLPATATPAPTRTPAPWPCVPYDYPEPSSTPPPPATTPRPEPTPCQNCIDLSKPVPYDLPISIAGQTIYLPAGSTYKGAIVDYLAGSEKRGPRLLEIIERGDSKVVIDGETGRIIESSSAAADDPDFRSLILEPLEPLQ
jgi:hypothetical protein